MANQTQALIIGITWAVLLMVYAFYRRFWRDRFRKHLLVIEVDNVVNQTSSPGSLLSKSGVLLVFGANIITFMLVIAAVLFPTLGEYVDRFRIALPGWINLVGSILFVLNAVWGLAVLVFNPDYTPLYKELSGQFLLARQGPYHVVRHPRYAAEAMLNIALFLFTGVWISLLGIIGWPAMHSQALAEEEYLMKVAGRAYAEYRRNTGMFFPRPKGRETNAE
jgi:protein-S-isoprenylcysteine O-methyltransferase Ste14